MHQPVDNLGVAITQAVELCYAPFFELMSQYPKFKFALHSSGWILEYIQTHYPVVFTNIKKCNIEFFTGGYYEPILSSIDEISQVNQIMKLTQFIKKNFSQTPKGLWLTERVWNDGIISALKLCGVEYVIVDDEHIYKANQNKIEGYWTTENGGDKISIFPINKELRYKIPFAKSSDSIDEVKRYSTAIIFDDLEKFGLWPKTHEWVYGQNWLHDFVQQAIDEVETIHFDDYHQQNSSLGLIYLPESSYVEMNEWADGKWKNFFTKYSESNRIHKRMLEFRELQNESLFKAQTNDVLWHGAFGGIYLPNLRDNAYKYIIECEDFLQDKLSVEDIEILGYPQLKAKTKELVMRFSAKGGTLIEFDDREARFNFQNTLTRRAEEYHQEILNSTIHSDDEIETIHNIQYDISDEVKDNLIFDDYERVSFIDLIKDGDKILKNFSNEIFNINHSYFSTDELIKDYNILNNGFGFQNSLIFTGTYSYVLEINLHFAHYNDLKLNSEIITNQDELLDNIFILEDVYTKRKIIIEFEQEMRLNYKLIKTLSQSEKGFDTIIQGINLNFEILFTDELELKGKFLCLK
jgi:alpha-amylase/alpha-mannosidase (GH57 family)